MCLLCDTNPIKVEEYGKIFGYPECCISEYISDTKIFNETNKDVRNKTQIKIAKETHGFVPCKKHAKMIKKGLVTAEELVFGRRNIEKSKELNRMADII